MGISVLAAVHGSYRFRQGACPRFAMSRAEPSANGTLLHRIYLSAGMFGFGRLAKTMSETLSRAGTGSIDRFMRARSSGSVVSMPAPGRSRIRSR